MLGALLVALAIQIGAPISELKQTADEQVGAGEAAPAGSNAARALFESAIETYRKVQTASSDSATIRNALDTIARLYDARHLANPQLQELTLRDLAALLPNDLSVLFRLSQVQEDQHHLDDAEITLLDARHSHPGEIEPNTMLARFYTRRALESAADTAVIPPGAPTGPTPDSDGYYRVDSAHAPHRLDIPQYPPEAQVSGIEGTVVIELSLDASGNTTAMRVVRSVPILDEAALSAVRNWHYDPSMADGQPVPTKMMVTVSFSLRK
jgi:TonB family protein